jgi:hypothetical protein
MCVGLTDQTAFVDPISSTRSHRSDLIDPILIESFLIESLLIEPS